MIPQIENLPDVSFIDNKTLDDVQEEMLADYQEKYEEVTGKSLVLRRADPESLKLYAASVQIYHMMLHIDVSGKMDLLKYAYSGFLDNLGALRGVERKNATPATVKVRFTLSAVQPSVVTIPEGTRVSDGDVIYFETDETREIAIGEMYVDVPCTCQTDGEEGNGFIAGQIATLVDPIAYVDSAVNTETSAGGADIESDEDFTDRIYLAPSGYSVAGPKDAYKYHTKSFKDAAIGDVEVTSPEPCEVEVRFLISDGSMPSETLCKKVLEHLNDDNIRPLTDRLSVLAPTGQEFDIRFTYYINKSDIDKAVSIQTAVAAAIQEYISWQTHTIGRDINPSVLTKMVVAAGAKRVVIESPAFETVPPGHVARVKGQNVTYGGVEDD
jgi:phage-related baseplate assembly protein